MTLYAGERSDVRLHASNCTRFNAVV